MTRRHPDALRATGELRLPLAPVSDANLAKIRDAMQRFGLLVAA